MVIVCVFFVAVSAFRKRVEPKTARAATWTLSIIISLFGLYWFVERSLLVS